MSLFDKLKAKLSNKKAPKTTKKEEKKEEGGEVHILPVPGVSISGRVHDYRRIFDLDSQEHQRATSGGRGS